MIYVIQTSGKGIGPIMHYESADRVMRAIQNPEHPAIFAIDKSYNGDVGTEDVSFNPEHVLRVIDDGHVHQ